jgi:class 3 adenylate cyclase/tetratricopeptide (TPR) repeat protein
VDLAGWLEGVGLTKYASIFSENDIDLEILAELSEADLEKLGLPLGARKKLLKAIRELSRQDFSPPGRPDNSRESAGPIEAERRQLTVMFCDLVGSTALSGRLDPEDYREVIKSYQKAVSEAVRRYEGYVAKYLGDGILAYFGYPQAHEDDAERAIRSGRAALDQVRSLDSRTQVSLDARIGIATGLVVAGDIAEEGLSESGAISGETPNLAARLQALAASGEIVISQATHRLVNGIFDCELLSMQGLKGIATATSAWRVRSEIQAASRFDAQHRAGLTDFVGRIDEVELLLRRWDQAKSGEGQVVLISGEPGIGKSRLARHVCDRLVGEAHAELRYQCSPHHINSALYPVASQLSLAAGIDADEPPVAKLDKLEALLATSGREMTSIAPLIAELLSIPYAGRYPALGLTPHVQKARTLEALKDHIFGLARRQPAILVFEDLHWLDPTTQDLLDLIVDQIQEAPVLALLTFRPDYQPRWVGQSHVALMALNRLSQRQCAEMASHVAAHAALPAGVLTEIVHRTEGVPLFVEELTRALLEGGMSEVVPTTIQASLLARLDRLGAAKQLAQIGAVLGREFDYSLIAAVSPIAGRKLDDALARLVGSELVFRRGAPPQATYIFKHALVQDAAYESLLKSRRRQLHADIATTLRTRFPLVEANEPELLAHHYAQAGLTEFAIGYWEKAGSRALERSANAEATGHYRAALALLGGLPPDARPAKELVLQVSLGNALSAAAGYGDSMTGAAYKRAWELCIELEDRKYVWPVLYSLSCYDDVAGSLDKARQTASKMVELAEESGESAPVLAAHSTLALILSHMGQWGEGHESAKKCIGLYDLQKHASLAAQFAEDPCVQAHAANSFCLWNLGYPDQAVQSLAQTIQLAEHLQHANSKAYALAVVPIVHTWLQDPEAALLASQACAISRETMACRSGSSWRGHLGAGRCPAREGIAMASRKFLPQSNCIASLAQR